ncbi:MAG: hypothetical protein PHT07_15425 [Paludibacter sp.]|nr:hypothetical protein [Paludibacter sp.]
MKGTVSINLKGFDLSVGYEYDHEEMKIGTGAGDSGQAGSTSLDIISIDASDTDWIMLLNSYEYVSDLFDDVRESVLKAIQ